MSTNKKSTLRINSSPLARKYLEWGLDYYGVEVEELLSSSSRTLEVRLDAHCEPLLLRLDGFSRRVPEADWLNQEEKQTWCLLHMDLYALENLREAARHALHYSTLRPVTGVEMRALNKLEDEVKIKLKELGWENPDTRKQKGFSQEV